ncbi:MAG: CSLREA domain-containing protein [Geminicoccaceae bacterium]
MANRSADARICSLQAMPEVRRKSGVLALSVLMGGVSGMAAAGEAAQEPCTPVCQHRQWLFAKLDQKMRPALPIIQARPMATFTVTTTADVVDPADGKLSLREAVDGANGTPASDAIGFAPALAGQKLVLTGGQLTVSQDLRINGHGDDGVAPITIDGGGKNRVLFIGGAGTDVVLRDLRIVGGYGGEGGGGGIRVGAANSLQLVGIEVSDNSAGGYYAGSGSGGGIHAEKNSRLIVNGSTIAHNLRARPVGC